MTHLKDRGHKVFDESVHLSLVEGLGNRRQVRLALELRRLVVPDTLLLGDLVRGSQIDSYQCIRLSLQHSTN